MISKDTLNYKKRDKVERIYLGKRTWLQRVAQRFKQLTSINFGRTTTWSYDRSYSSRDGTINYRELAGEGRNNAIVYAAMDLLATTFAQSPIVVKQLSGDQEVIVPNHEMVQRIRRPNDYYSGQLLWKATMIDYAFGNAYWLKVRSGAGKPVQFYWVPSHTITPMWPNDNTTVFISHYEYTPNGTVINVAPEDVLHFRNGLDPKNIRKGLSPLGALLREIVTDEEAAEFTHTILRNLGVTGMIISPSNEKGKITQADADKIKASVMNRTQGDRRGEPLVIGGSIKVDQMATDVTKLDLSAIRHIPEERITAIFGTPAILLGLGTGLENATYSNVDGLRRIFYENKVIPIQNFIAADLHTQLMSDYVSNVDAFTIEFDNENVRVLKEDETQQVDRLLKELESGALTVNEYRAERDREPYPTDMYMLASRIIPVAVDDIVKKATVQDQPEALAAGNQGALPPGDGNDTTTTTNADGSTVTSSSTSSAGKARTTTTSTKDISDSVDRIRARMIGQCANDVHAYLNEQRAFVVAQIEDQSKARKIRINWPRVQQDYDTLKGVLEPWYKRTLTAVHDVVQDILDTRYELTGTDERTYLKAAALNIKGINEYTRTSVAKAVATSVELDETVEELAMRINDLYVFSESRALEIARTELAQATNLSQIESYKASDVVVGVRITDGDQDSVCAALNGRRVKIAEARSIPPLGHPNCVRRFWHILDAAELAESEAA